MRVLVVEDDLGVRETLTDLLTASGHAVTAAADFSEAMVLLQNATWDALLTDLVLPGGSGMDLAALAQSKGAGPVVCSGHPARIEQMHGEGVMFLVKPFSAEALERALAEVTLRAQPQSH